MAQALENRIARKRRHIRVRKKVSGNAEIPRLNVYRSLRHIYAQLIDDHTGHTLASASTLDLLAQKQLTTSGNQEAARLVGELLANRALEKGITQAVFDRGGYLYHGRVKALAEGARHQGLKI